MRLAKLRWSGDLAIDICKESDRAFMKVVECPLPLDARFVRAFTDEDGWIWLIAESESFQDVPEGARIPELKPPRFTREFMTNAG